MSGFDDPRYLQQVITKLQADVAHLKKSTLPLASQQRGPIPGSMRAVQINDVGLKSSMWLNLAGSQPGQAPYQAVTDSNGTIRVEEGNLAANGVSPAQFGFRANDASGNPLFDSLGVLGPMTQLADQFTGVINQTINGAVTAASVTNGSVTFSIPRQLRVLSAFTIVANSSGNFGYSNAMMDGSDGGAGASNHHFAVHNGGWFIVGTHLRLDTLSTGSHTAAFSVDVDAAQSVLVFRGNIKVFQLGS